MERIHVSEYLSEQERSALLGVLMEYQEYFSNRPGKCNVFEYEFQMQGDLPTSRNTRPIPFALRQEVREQI
jgi:hypothetical protein